MQSKMPLVWQENGESSLGQGRKEGRLFMKNIFTGVSSHFMATSHALHNEHNAWN
jgi:hypothetical protein